MSGNTRKTKIARIGAKNKKFYRIAREYGKWKRDGIREDECS